MSGVSPQFRHEWSRFRLARERFRRAFLLAAKSLWLHRLRSLLTVLGIVFGVCSVIAMLAIGEGASSEAQEQIKNLGSQNIIVKSVKPTEDQKTSGGGGRRSFVLEYGLKIKDMERIQATIPGVAGVVPVRIIRDYVRNAGRRVDCEALGTVPEYFAQRGLRLSRGRFFAAPDMDGKANVCVISSEMAEKLFPAENALGKDVRLGGNYYRVVGLLEPLTRLTADQTAEISSTVPLQRMFIPLTTCTAFFGEVLIKRRTGSFEAERVQLHELIIQAADQNLVTGISLAVKDLLESTHNKKDYDIVVPLELLKRAERTKQIFNIVLGSIAAISLLVGGIGIMNIMLASVTERTREIGIRRALGARRRDIVVQFLVESVILSGAGGIIGVLLGIAIPFAVTWLAEMKTIVTFWSPLIAFSISALVGVVFGIYPAIRAADMDPVEALRHD